MIITKACKKIENFEQDTIYFLTRGKFLLCIKWFQILMVKKFVWINEFCVFWEEQTHYNWAGYRSSDNDLFSSTSKDDFGQSSITVDLICTMTNFTLTAASLHFNTIQTGMTENIYSSGNNYY